MTRAGEPWTPEEVEKVKQLRSEGVTWADVAARIGRAKEATRKGPWYVRRRAEPFSLAKAAARRAEMIERVEAGERVCDAARAAGVKKGTAYRALHRAGLDAEVRRMYAAE
jgi:hypothetical protein